jgi:hypothetical protein
LAFDAGTFAALCVGWTCGGIGGIGWRGLGSGLGTDGFEDQESALRGRLIALRAVAGCPSLGLTSLGFRRVEFVGIPHAGLIDDRGTFDRRESRAIEMTRDGLGLVASNDEEGATPGTGRLCDDSDEFGGESGVALVAELRDKVIATGGLDRVGLVGIIFASAGQSTDALA